MPDAAMGGAPRYARHEADFYETPEWVTRVLLQHVTLGKVWEPACGNGAIAKALSAHGIDVAASDLHDRGYGTAGKDFLDDDNPTSRDIVTNPPYSLAYAFVRHALNITEGRSLVAMLMRNEWDTAKTRDDLFDPNGRFMAKVVLTERPRWIAGTTERPRHTYAWYVWGPTPTTNAPVILRGR